MVAYIILGVAVGVFAVAGLVTGLVKGYVKVQTWGLDYAITMAITVIVGAILTKTGAQPLIGGIVMLAVPVAVLALCFLGANIIKKILIRAFDKRDEDLKSYGGLGIFNRIFGGVTLLIKGALIALVIVVIPLAIADLTQIGAVTSLFGNFFAGGLWGFIKSRLFDFIVVAFIQLAMRHGYATGVSSALWSLLVLGLVVGAGFLAWNLAFRQEAFNGIAATLAETISGKAGGSLNPTLAENIARGIITAGLFLIMAIVIGLTSFLVSRVITFARMGSAFYCADGILGAIIMVIIILAVLLVLGNILTSFHDMQFMQYFNTYFDKCSVARAVYGSNLLNCFGVNIIPAQYLQNLA